VSEANDLLDAALASAQKGWAVFPCAPRNKQPLTKRGFLDASTDPALIERWWRSNADANLGIATGAARLVVIDIDPKNGGFDSFFQLCKQHGPLESATVLTGGGGEHRYFQAPADATIKSRSNAFGPDFPGIDVRAQGGYVIAPPSVHPSGNVYRPEVSSGATIAPLPSWAVRLLAGPDRTPIRGTDDELPIDQGGRHAELMRFAGRLRRLNTGAPAIHDALAGVNRRQCKPPLPDDDVAHIVASVMKYPPGVAGNAWSPIEELNFSQNTELRAKEYFVRCFQRDLRFVIEAKAFFHFDGTRWIRDGGDVALGLAQTIARKLYELASDADDENRPIIGKFAVFCESRRTIAAMVNLAAADPRMVARIGDFDRDPFLLNTPAGTVDLRSGCIRAHDRDDLITKSTGVAFNAGAACNRWERFLDEIFADHPEIVAYLHRAIGYSVTGDTREEKMLVCYGGGANGKSTLIETLKRSLGDYATTCDPDTLLARGRKEATNDVARLAGARFVSCVEVNQGRALDESRVKALTSSDTLTARFLFREYFEFRPELKLWLGTNYRPEIRGTDDGIWRRVHLIPFEAKFQGAKRDVTLQATLAHELPGILAWAVRGTRLWQDKGLDPPASVLAATQAYRAESDLIGQFLDERCELDNKAIITVKALYGAFKTWAENAGEKPMKATPFGLTMTERGLGKHGKHHRKGVKIRRDDNE